MGQADIRYMNESAGVPGAPVGPLKDTISKSVGGFASDVYTITVDTNVDGGTYTVTMEGISGNDNVITWTGVAAIADTAKAGAVAIGSNVDVAGAWSASFSGAVITIQAKEVGKSLAVSESDVNLSLAQTSSASSGTGLGYGIAAELQTDDTILPADGSGVMIGISVRQNAGFTSGFDRATGAIIPAGENATLLASGQLEVQLDSGVSSVAATDTVYYRVGGTGILGSFTNAADGGNTVELVGAKFLSAAKRIHNQPTYAARILFSVA